MVRNPSFLRKGKRCGREKERITMKKGGKKGYKTEGTIRTGEVANKKGEGNGE